MYKTLASYENIGGCSKYWRFMKILADAQILALHENIGGYSKYWRFMKI
jgi:hypothetical protein